MDTKSQPSALIPLLPTPFFSRPHGAHAQLGEGRHRERTRTRVLSPSSLTRAFAAASFSTLRSCWNSSRNSRLGARRPPPHTWENSRIAFRRKWF